jgi:hypothetical protein
MEFGEGRLAQKGMIKRRLDPFRNLGKENTVCQSSIAYHASSP